MRQAGATIPEYALVIGLVVLLLLWFQGAFVNVLKNSYNDHNDEFNYINTPTIVP